MLEPSEQSRDPRQLTRWRDPEEATPKIAVWEITLLCDLGCKHCGSRAGRAREDELSTEEALDLVQQLADLGLEEVVLIGGEAYLRPDWHRIAAEVKRRGMVCTMVTGGRNLDEERVALARDAGVRQIAVSIDGLRQTHDALRGFEGSWQAAVAAAERVASSGIQLAANSQINRLSMPELPALARQIVDLGAAGWQVQLTVAMGRAADRPDLLLQPYHLLDLMPLLYWIDREILRPGHVELFPGNNVGYFGPYAEQLRFGAELGHTWSGCAAGATSLGIEADGTIKGCPSLPTEPYTGGNIRSSTLRDLHGRAPELNDLPRRTQDDLWGFCQGCEHADRCLAGCTWTSHVLFGRPGNNPYCHHRALDFQSRGLRERLRKRWAAIGQPFDYGRYEVVVEPNEARAEEDSPLPLTYLARLFGAHPDARSMWPKTTLDRVLDPR